jgi:hypothetical protein
MSSRSFESRNSKIEIQNVIGHNLFKDLDVQNKIKMSILFIGFWNLDISVCKEGHKKCITKLDDNDKTKYNISFVFEKKKI